MMSELKLQAMEIHHRDYCLEITIWMNDVES